jgi:hypothetical protein
MAGTTKKISEKATQTTKLRESIPITGSIVSGTYAEPNGAGTTSNIKEYTHEMFQSVYDYPYASSSANHLFDLTAGYGTDSSLDGVTGEASGSKKNNIYNEMAQVLVGFDLNRNIHRFDKDGNLTGGAKFDEIITINVARLLAKDGIQKGTFELELGVSGSDAGYAAPFDQRIKIKDLDGTSSYKVNSPKGEYGILYANNSTGYPLDGVGIDPTDKDAPCGLIYYQAGVVVLSASMFMPSANGGIMSASTNNLLWLSSSSRQEDIHEILTSGSIEEVATGLRRRMYNMSFNNTTDLVSTIYLCDAGLSDFNFSSNPTYLNGSEIRVKGSDPKSPPKTYITTIGLYNGADQLLAVAKLSKPIEKNPSQKITLKVRLDY